MTALDSRAPRADGTGTVYRTTARPMTRSLAVTGTLAVLQAVFVSLVLIEVVTVVAWALEPKAHSTAGSTLRFGAALWTLALHARVHSGSAVFGLPLPGLTLLVGWLLSKSVTRLVRHRLDDGDVALTGGQETARVMVAIACPLALLAAVIAGAARGDQLTPSPRTAALGGFAVGAVAAVLGVRRAWREVDPTPLVQRLPEGLGVIVRASTSVLLCLTVLGAAVMVGMLALHHSVATGLQGALAAGVLGGFALVLLQLALAPTAVLFAVSWLAGPGFALGSGTSVSPAGTRLGDVPALPLLAALPGGSHGPGLVAVVPILLLGVVAGLYFLRPDDSRLGRCAALGALSGAGAAVVMGLACALVGGPAGSGRMQTVGPSGLWVALALTMELTPTMALGAILRVYSDRETSTEAV